MVTPILFFLLLISLISQNTITASDSKKIKTAFSTSKQSTAKYGAVDVNGGDDEDGSIYTKQLEYNLNEFPIDEEKESLVYQDCNDACKKKIIRNNDFVKLVIVENDVCDCAVTVFYDMENENQCYSDCIFEKKKRCRCDYLSLNKPMLLLCYKHNCASSSAMNKNQGNNVFAPLAAFFFYLMLFFLFCLLIAYNISQ